MRNKTAKRTSVISLVLVMILATSLFNPLVSFGTVDALKIKDTGAYLLKQNLVPSYGMVRGDWTVLGLARSGMGLPASFGAKYLESVERALNESKGELSKNKYSEYSRLILGLGALGKNPKNIGGYDLLLKLTDLELIERQGINGPIYALLALDSMGYDSHIREELIGSILKRELPGGGFSLSGNTADPDVTAAALQALGRYKARTEVNRVIDRALTILSRIQLNSGGFAGWSAGNVENVESIAQVILALTALGIDPYEDDRFIKQDKNEEKAYMIDALISFRLPNGSYSHTKGGDSDDMATEQAFMAVVSIDRMLKGQNYIFRMGDILGSKYKNKVLLNGEYLNFDVEPIIENGRTFVPMRAIFEALGTTVEWDGELRRVKANLNEIEIMLEIGRPCMMVSELMVKLDVAPMIKNDRTLVPLRFVADSLGADVNWDPDTRTAIVDLR